ncbi:putative ABC transporter [Mollisia scopiformis]|uniref:Putative ABC transporter n=1 Tax=Mollisia scopiformis TaxID=149040 RepID=A0A132B719_MOLSC|nr:putative ABC transporter [Mollisia scopiformis]KUJ08206.1 putative ABC transporter [Mollisia scopiformis]
MSLPVLIRCLLYLMLFTLECCGKPPLTTSSEPRIPEESSGALSMIFFTWINPILLRGYRNILNHQDLPPMSQNMKAYLTRKNMLRMWDQRAKPESKKSLPLALFRCIKKPFLAAIMPRLFLIIFRYSQPSLIKQAIRFVDMPPTTPDSHYGYWLVVSAVVIYIGLAISTSMYQHRLNMIKLMIRSALVGLIHDKTMNSPSIAYDNGESTTLMSTDADSLVGIGEMFHETWAQLVEVVIGISLLATQVGWIWPLPLFLIFLCSRVSRYVATHLQPCQKAWNSATQRRVAATSSMLSSMKTIKMLGFKESLTNRIMQLRNEELVAASKLRWMMVYYNASANALGIFSPAITLAIFAVIAAFHGQNLDAETAFPTIAILSMVTHPANMVMTIVPRAIGTLASFDRIQTFLLRQSLLDHRVALAKGGPAIQIEDLRIGEILPVLENVNLEVTPGSLTIISGPVGSGKSTLLRAILGEVTPSHGSIKVTTKRIGYCAQIPWLPSGSIRDVILGTAKEIDERWYQEVFEKCCLIHDLKSLPDDDETQIGSRGMNLSGGQRQRFALARALFARCEIALLDDTLSGLDGETEKSVFENLFGSQGVFRRLKTTVVLVSNSTQYFSAADRIVVLGDHGIKEQGTWREIKSKSASISKFIPHHPTSDETVLSSSFDKLRAQLQASGEAELDLSRQTGDLALYGYYLHFAGKINILLIIALTSSYSFFSTIPQYWLQLWTEDKGGHTVFYTCGLLLLALAAWSITSVMMWATIIRLAPHSGRVLHERLLFIVTCAPLSFFSKTSNGSILNRFTQDILLIDKQLPSALSSLAAQSFKLTAQIILLFISQRLLTLSLPLLLLVLLIVQKIYLRTSRQLRFLELEARASVFSSFLETISGIETIRTFDWRKEIIEQNVEYVEESQRPEYLLLALQRWLGVVLDLVAAALATAVVGIAVRGGVEAGSVGVGLGVLLVTNSTLLKLVENWTEMEISLGAVARLKTLEKETGLEGEGVEEIEISEDWPSNGCVEIKDITVAYGDNVVLKNFNLTITPGQKTILYGRTGSGKSTLILSLLRLVPLQSGTITIDNLPTSHIPLPLLRSRAFITISQDPLLSPHSTVRYNLDPSNSSPSSILISALQITGLWQHQQLDTGTILDTPLSEMPELSVGQMQMFALCRAVVKVRVLTERAVRPVVLLDEVTASLDAEREERVDAVVEEEFLGRGCAVLVVGHRRVRVVEGRDRVVWMGGGRVFGDVGEVGRLEEEG